MASGDIKPLTSRKGPDANPRVSPDGKRVAYTGHDWAKDTWIDSKIYVMNIDGSNPRLVSGDWDRAPSELRWATDGSALYFTAQNEGSQNFYVAAARRPARRRCSRSRRACTCWRSRTSSQKGVAVGTLTELRRRPATSSPST